MLSLEKSFIYRVQQGDTLKSIYKTFNTSPENVTRNNNDIPIYAGEVICIKTNNYITHVVKPTETIEDIANLYKTEKSEIIKQNNLQTSKLFIGQIIKIFKTN